MTSIYDDAPNNNEFAIKLPDTQPAAERRRWRPTRHESSCGGGCIWFIIVVSIFRHRWKLAKFPVAPPTANVAVELQPLTGNTLQLRGWCVMLIKRIGYSDNDGGWGTC